VWRYELTPAHPVSKRAHDVGVAEEDDAAVLAAVQLGAQVALRRDQRQDRQVCKSGTGGSQDTSAGRDSEGQLKPATIDHC